MKTAAPFEQHQRVRLNAGGAERFQEALRGRCGTVTRPPKPGNRHVYVRWDGVRYEDTVGACGLEVSPDDGERWAGSNI